MKNQASAKEERKESHNTADHGELSLIRRYSLWFIIFISLILSQLKPSAAQAELRRTVLDNGMIVIIKEDHSLQLVSIFLCVRSGSAQEGKFRGSGISHFIEHMLFKGTRTRGAGEIFKEIEYYGGKINGFTSYDYTGYRIIVPSRFTFSALEILADMITKATFDIAEFKKEKEVILKEIGFNYDDPQRYAWRLLWQKAYTIHPYQYPIIGEEHLFNNLSRQDLLEFYRTNYVPNNMVLAVVGDVQIETVLNFIKEIFKDFVKKPIINYSELSEPRQKELRRYEERFTSGITYLLLGFHSTAITDEDTFALDILGVILGEGESSRLYRQICKRKRLAYNIEAINYTPQDPGLFIISCLLEERNYKRTLSSILKQVDLIKKRSVSEDELESAKNKIISDILFNTQTIEAQAEEFALNEALTGNFRFTEKYIQKIKEVNSQDIMRVANKYLTRSSLNIVALMPKDKSVRPAPFKGSGGALKKFGIENLTKNEPAFLKRYILDNGLRLIIEEDRRLPLVSIKIAFKGGLRVEDENSNGLCNLVAQMLDKGTGTRSASEIAYLVESRGAHLSYFSGNNSFGLSMDLPSKDFDQMLALLSDLIINSTFPQSEIKRLKENNLARLKAQKDNIFEYGVRLLKSTLFQRHPYRFPTIGNEKSIRMLRRRDLINFYRNFCVGKNMVLAVFGDISAEETLIKIKDFFSELKAGDTPHIAPPEEQKIKSVKTSFKISGKKQSLILIGFHGASVFSRDRYTLELLCQLLSRSSGRLFTRVREERGLAYTMGAYSVPGLDPGYIVIYVATTSENVERVKKIIFEQLHILKQNLISEEELVKAKRTLVGEKLISRQTNSARAMESALDELYGLGYNYHLKYFDRINQIEAEDIRKCARRYFDLDNYAIVVIGPQGQPD